MELFPVHKRWVRKIYFCRFIYWDLDLKGSECALSMEYVFCSKSEIIAVTITRISKNSVPQRSRYRHRCTVAGLRGPKTGNAHSGKTERWLNEQIGQIEAHRNPMDSSVAILWKLEEGPEMVGVLPHAPLVRKRAETTIWDMFNFHPPAHCAVVKILVTSKDTYIPELSSTAFITSSSAHTCKILSLTKGALSKIRK